MRAYRLNDTVKVTYPNFFGKESTVYFVPLDRNGWYWLPELKSEPVPLDYQIAITRKNRIVMRDEQTGSELNVVEHITPLRFLGIDGVGVYCDNAWPPHFGRTSDYWERIKPHLVDARYEVPRFFPMYNWAHESSGGALKRSVTWHKRTDGNPDSLVINAYVNYPGIGRAEESFMLNYSKFDANAQKQLEYIMSIPSQGYPRWRRPINKVFNVIGMGPRPGSVVWPQEHADLNWVIERFVTHRVLDIYGALGLISHTELPKGTFNSSCGGHALDMRLISRLSS